MSSLSLSPADVGVTVSMGGAPAPSGGRRTRRRVSRYGAGEPEVMGARRRSRSRRGGACVDGKDENGLACTVPAPGGAMEGARRRRRGSAKAGKGKGGAEMEGARRRRRSVKGKGVEGARRRRHH